MKRSNQVDLAFILCGLFAALAIGAIALRSILGVCITGALMMLSGIIMTALIFEDN